MVHGLVDADCRWHDVANLCGSGASIFPTAGQRPDVDHRALGVRLADHLDISLRRSLDDIGRAARDGLLILPRAFVELDCIAYDRLVTDDLDVVIVAYNSEHVLGDLLDSLPGALGDLTARIVVVDNGSTDETLNFLRQRGGCLVVESSNVGYSAGINRGVEALEGNGPILILNPDLRMGKDSVGPLVETLGLPGTGIVAPQVLNADGSRNLSLRREPTMLRAAGLGFTGRPLLSEHVTEPAAYRAAGVHAWALGAVLIVSRDCHDALQGWDESFFLYSEETDFCLRARDRGWVTRYDPRSSVTHIGGQSGRSPRIHAMQIINRVRLYRRRHGALASWLYYGLTVASEASWVVRGHRQSLSSLVALLRKTRRPVELGCSQKLMPQ